MLADITLVPVSVREPHCRTFRLHGLALCVIPSSPGKVPPSDDVGAALPGYPRREEPMSRSPLSARISPTILLEKITIELSSYQPPMVELTGRVATGNRRVDMASAVTLKTGAIGPAGRAFLEELREQFANQATGQTAPPKATTGAR